MAVNIIARQVGNDVIFSGSGSVNTADLFDYSNQSVSVGQINPSNGSIKFGNSSTINQYFIMGSHVDITNFGTSSTTNADINSGDGFELGGGGFIYLPSGYTSSSPLSLYMAFTGQTISSLQLSAGTYISTWGTAPNEETVTLLIEPEPSPTPTPTTTQTPTPTVTPTNTPTVTPTKTTTPTPTPTNTRTPTNTPTPSITPTITPTNTKTPTPTPSITPSVTPTITPTPTSYGVLDVNVQYDYTNEIFGSFSGGSWMEQYGNVPHPINYDPSRRLTVIDLSSITIGGQNGLNN